MKKRKVRSLETTKDLTKALLDQALFCSSKKIARWLAENGAHEEQYPDGAVIIQEGDTLDRDVFCIVSGQVKVAIGGHKVSTRGRNSHVGEMAMIMREPRTASVMSEGNSLLVRIPEKTMRRAFEKFPKMWYPVATTLCARLHERKKFFRVKNSKPVVFIGSSGARKFVAESLRLKLKPLIDGEVRVWTDDEIFSPSSVTLDALIEQSKLCDFGIFIFGADDKVNSKGKNHSAPRDNVVFEGGMFTGTCGLCRTFFICEDDIKLKMPSDLSGVTFLKFSLQEPHREIPLFGNAVTRIAKNIERLGVV